MAFFGRFQAAPLKTRGLALQGITTDGSSLLIPGRSSRSSARYPHRVCTFHVPSSEVTKAVLGAVAKLQDLAAGLRKLAHEVVRLPRPPGVRPSTKRIEQKIGDLFEHRYLFVKRRLKASERKTLAPDHCAVSGQLRSLRGLMEEVYRLFDRRCQTATALAKLAKLRTRLRRCRPVESRR